MAIEVVDASNFADFVARNSPDADAPVQITSGGESTLVDPGIPSKGGAAQPTSDDSAKGKPFQERINELTRLRKEADEFAEGEYNARVRSDERIKALETELEELRKGLPTPADDETGKPDPKSYKEGEEAKYWEDLAKWTADKAVAKDRIEQRAQAEKQAAEAESARILSEHEGRVREFKKSAPDYDEVFAAIGENPIRPWLKDAVLESDHSAELAYHLAKNPDEVVRLNKMKAITAVRELGRLESRLVDKVEKLDSQRQPDASAATPTRTRNIPAPITPVRGGESTIDKDPRQPMPYSEYKALRRAGRIK